MSPDDYIIRDYQAGDFEELMYLWKNTGLGSPERGDDASTIERCNAMGGKLLVMFHKPDKRLMGSCWMTCDGRRLHMHHFGIDPEFQGKGLGKILGQECLKFIREKGMQVKLEVHKSNQKAVQLYRKLGFFSFVDYDIMMIRNVSEIKPVKLASPETQLLTNK